MTDEEFEKEYKRAEHRYAEMKQCELLPLIEVGVSIK